MDATDPSSELPTSEHLQHLRTATERISKSLHGQLESFAAVLRPVFVPQRLLGRYVEHPGNRSVPDEERAWSRLLESYRKVAASLSALPRQLESPLPPIDPALELHPWEYMHTIEGQAITVTCPCKWILAYRCDQTLSEFRQAIASEVRGKLIQPFVTNGLVMAEVIRSIANLDRLFAALRFELGVEASPDVRGLSFAVLTFALKSSLPPADLVLTTTRLTGIPRFTELIEPSSVADLPDPLKDELQDIVSNA